MIPYMVSGDGNVSIVLGGAQYNVRKGSENYEEVLEALRNDATEEAILEIVNPAKKVLNYLFDTELKVEDGVVLFNGEEVHNSTTDRILLFMEEGLPTAPLFNFMKKVANNPSFSARKELFDFLDHRGLPLTEDGDFLAYKAVTSDYKDKYTGTIDNSIGQKPEMKRAAVDDDRNHDCSEGYHAGTLQYAAYQYGNLNAGDKVVITKIDPENVVSVPLDCSCQKLRMCKYEVIADYKGELTRNLYTNTGEVFGEEGICTFCGESKDDCECNICPDCKQPADNCECEKPVD